MSFNKFMHPRNKYRVPPDFKQLAIQYPEFRKHLTQDLSGKLKFNFQNPEALRIFTTTLLHKDFGLNVEIPSSRLVPTLSLRLNYILWIEDLLKANQILAPIHGIDIGTGASCIYPLLGHQKNAWHMLALENDPLSCEYAQRNVKQNDMQDYVTVKHTTPSNNLCLESYVDPNVSYAFTMCNPPFFASPDDAGGSFQEALSVNDQISTREQDTQGRLQEANTGHVGTEQTVNSEESSHENTSTNEHVGTETSIQGKLQGQTPSPTSAKRSDSRGRNRGGRRPPLNGHTGQLSELVVEGGEVEFVKRLVEENMSVKNVRIFTTMLGHKSSFISLKHYLLQHPLVKQVSSTEFCQGNTMRWGLAWTAHADVRLPTELPGKRGGSTKAKPVVTLIEGREGGVREMVERVMEMCDQLKIIYKILHERPDGGATKLVLTAFHNTWSHQRRNKRRQAMATKFDASKRTKNGTCDAECGETRTENGRCDGECGEKRTKNGRCDGECGEKRTENGRCDGERFQGTHVNGCTRTYYGTTDINETKNSCSQHKTEEENSTNHSSDRIGDKNDISSNLTSSSNIGKSLTNHNSNGFLDEASISTNEQSPGTVITNKDKISTNHSSDKKLTLEKDKGLTNCNSDTILIDKDKISTNHSSDKKLTLEKDKGLTNCNSDTILIDKDKISTNHSSGSSANQNSPGAPLVVCNVLIESVDSLCENTIVMEMIWVSGTGSKDLPHQIMQWFKNNLSQPS